MKASVAVIGAGIVGSMITRFLRTEGYDVLLFDNREPMAGSKCSAGVWRDSWVDKSIKEQTEMTVAIVEQLMPGAIQEIEFDEYKNNGEKVKSTLFKLDVESILVDPDKIVKISKITEQNKLLFEDGKHSQQFDFIVIAAGVWTNTLLTKSGIAAISAIDGMFGGCLYFERGRGNVIKTWAPYKQIVGFEREGGYYFGDGFTVKNPPINSPASDPRVPKNLSRLLQHAIDCGLDSEVVSDLRGFRPYLQNKEDNIVNSYKEGRVISAVGTAKNATILCGWIAANVSALIEGTINEL